MSIEREFKLEVYGIELVCENCGIGTLSATGKLNVETGLYPHKCNICESEVSYEIKYPTVGYRRAS